MTWELKKVGKLNWVQDDSGYYTYIHSVRIGIVRLDIITTDGEPIISFQGKADDVRKAVMRWFESRISQKAGLGISLEHAAYIGAELAKAELLGIDYIQD